MRHLRVFVLTIFVFTGIHSAAPQNRTFVDSVAATAGNFEQEVTQVTPGLYMLQPYGLAGNTGVLIGADGVILIDDQYQLLSERIEELVAEITPKPILYIINTHYHFDHTHGNLAFGPAGVPILAHTMAAKRMSEEQVMPTFFDVVQAPYPENARPTFSFDSRMELAAGPETLHLIHLPNAHTDGDVIVYFPENNAYQTGDLFLNVDLSFIHIDERAGGDIYGVIGAVEYLIDHSDATTRIIPGHGPVATRDDLIRYRDRLTKLVSFVEVGYRSGLSPEEISANIREEMAYEHQSGEKFIRQLHRSVVRKMED